MNDTEKRRKQLLEQMRNIYDEKNIPPAVHPRYGSAYRRLYEEDREFEQGTLGIRVFICVLLFVAFTVIEQKNYTIMNNDSGKIANEIHQTIDFSTVWKNL